MTGVELALSHVAGFPDSLRSRVDELVASDRDVHNLRDGVWPVTANISNLHPFGHDLRFGTRRWQ